MPAFPERLLPGAVVYGLRRVRWAAVRRRYEAMSTEQIFTSVYARSLWGGRRGEFCSGAGSDPAVAAEYCRLVTDLVARHRIRSILDLGCGDFRVGSQLVPDGVSYTGMDVVPDLVRRNQSRYGSDRIRFVAGDIVRDDWPDADLVLVRQVLQHLSNQQVATVLARLAGYPLALVTEHLPSQDTRFVPNLDKAQGPDTRLLRRSGIVPDLPPFSVPGVREVLTTPIQGPRGRGPELLRTWTVTGSAGGPGAAGDDG